MKLASVRHEVAESPLTLLEYVMEQGWGDGLPVIPPTEERVATMWRHQSGRPRSPAAAYMSDIYVRPTRTSLAKG